MPTVPQAEPRVEPAPMPGIRVQPGAPAEAFGLGEGRQALDRAVLDVVADAQKRADQLAVAKAERYTAELTSTLDMRARQVKGDKALGAAESALADYDKGMKEVEKNLSSGEQRQAYQAAALNRRISLDRSLQVHVAGERAKFDQETTGAIIALAKDWAVRNYLDEYTVEFSVFDALKSYEDFAKSNNVPEEARKVEMQKIESDIRSDVIKSYVANNQPLQAQKFLEDYSDKLTAGDRLELQRLVKSGKESADAYALGDQIIDQTIVNVAKRSAEEGLVGRLPTMVDAAGAVRSIREPGLRDKVEERVAAGLANYARVEKERADATFDKALKAVYESDGDVSVIDSVTWDGLTFDRQVALREVGRKIRQIGKVDTDIREFDRLEGLMADDPAAFLAEDIPAKSALLSLTDMRYFSVQQRAIKKGEAKTLEELKKLSFDRRIVTDTLNTYEQFLDSQGADKVRITAEAMDYVRTKIKELQSGPKARKAEPEDVQKFIDDYLAIPGKPQPRSWLSFPWNWSTPVPGRPYAFRTPAERGVPEAASGVAAPTPTVQEAPSPLTIPSASRKRYADLMAEYEKKTGLVIPSSDRAENIWNAESIYRAGGTDEQIKAALFAGSVAPLPVSNRPMSYEDLRSAKLMSPADVETMLRGENESR